MVVPTFKRSGETRSSIPKYAFRLPISGKSPVEQARLSRLLGWLTQFDAMTGESEPANAVRVQFTPGTSSANLENSVVRGTRDVYVLGAQANQSMSVKITSLENNAVFDVLSPSNEVLRWESTDEELALSETGEYYIVVGGTRGNATYQLEVGIY